MPQNPIEAFRFDGVINVIKRPAVRGKFHVITRPAISDQRRGQPAMLRQNVAREVAPDMIAAKAFALFDEYNM